MGLAAVITVITVGADCFCAPESRAGIGITRGVTVFRRRGRARAVAEINGGARGSFFKRTPSSSSRRGVTGFREHRQRFFNAPTKRRCARAREEALSRAPRSLL